MELHFLPALSLLNKRVQWARDVDACFSTLRVGRGPILGTASRPALPEHFASFAWFLPAARPVWARVLAMPRAEGQQRYAEQLEPALAALRRAGLSVFVVPPREPLTTIARLVRGSARLAVGAEGAALSFAAFLPRPAAVVQLAVPSVWAESTCREGWNANPHTLWGSFFLQAGIDHACLMQEAGPVAGLTEVSDGEKVSLGHIDHDQAFKCKNNTVDARRIVAAVLETLERMWSWSWIRFPNATE